MKLKVYGILAFLSIAIFISLLIGGIVSSNVFEIIGAMLVPTLFISLFVREYKNKDKKDE